ncbi:major facilitator superfamily domain-containing protein [Rhodocollybia butyracea]|uniref:Major facilitator superfamily domain-containing protein n=1 Tax=Rhodocollybia butyracea TaxID=206335 RepID=A0A9P5U9F4_9AGAR|nr:major facilitator superfamily domain-containing protein [Rhodocollybia butyracea]
MSANSIRTFSLETETIHDPENGSNNEKTDGLKDQKIRKQTGEDVDDFPDGGLRAWLMVLGTFLTTFATFGFVNSWGVFQAYYEQNLLKDSTASDIAWIGSYALVFFPALVTGRLFDIGIFKIPFATASAILVATSFLTGQCTKYWQFILCQGIALGLTCGMLFGPSMGVIGHWFKRKRGLALGVNALGSSLGGTVIPIATRRLLVEVGFPWTMRILGFLMLFALAFPNIILARRLPPKRAPGGILDFAAFKSAPYTIYCISALIAFLGMYTVLTYIEISANSVGIDDNFSFYLVSITNAASGFGRITAGITADKFGAINFLAPMTIIAGILTYAWPLATTKSEFIIVGIIYGFSSGVYVSCFLIPVYEMSPVNDIGRRTGLIMTFGAVGALVGPPISGAINTATGGFRDVGYYAGSTIILSVAFMIITRQLVLKQLWGKF